MYELAEETSCANYSNTFTMKGCNNWQRSAFNEHNISMMHSDANDDKNRETWKSILKTYGPYYT